MLILVSSVNGEISRSIIVILLSSSYCSLCNLTSTCFYILTSISTSTIIFAKILIEKLFQ